MWSGFAIVFMFVSIGSLGVSGQVSKNILPRHFWRSTPPTPKTNRPSARTNHLGDDSLDPHRPLGLPVFPLLIIAHDPRTNARRDLGHPDSIGDGLGRGMDMTLITKQLLSRLCRMRAVWIDACA